MDGAHKVHIVPTNDVTGRETVTKTGTWRKTVLDLWQEWRSNHSPAGGTGDHDSGTNFNFTDSATGDHADTKPATEPAPDDTEIAARRCAQSAPYMRSIRPKILAAHKKIPD